jgi:hypothetical protein
MLFTRKNPNIIQNEHKGRPRKMEKETLSNLGLLLHVVGKKFLLLASLLIWVGKYQVEIVFCI